MTDRRLWIAARRLTSAFASGAGDNFIELVEEIDVADGWKVVALALNADAASLAHVAHGDQAQQWLDNRVVRMLDTAVQDRDPD